MLFCFAIHKTKKPLMPGGRGLQNTNFPHLFRFLSSTPAPGVLLIVLLNLLKQGCLSAINTPSHSSVLTSCSRAGIVCTVMDLPFARHSFSYLTSPPRPIPVSSSFPFHLNWVTVVPGPAVCHNCQRDALCNLVQFFISNNEMLCVCDADGFSSNIQPYQASFQCDNQ